MTINGLTDKVHLHLNELRRAIISRVSIEVGRRVHAEVLEAVGAPFPEDVFEYSSLWYVAVEQKFYEVCEVASQ